MKTHAELDPAAVGAAPRRRKNWATVLMCLLIFGGGSVVGAGVTVMKISRLSKDAIEHPDLLPERMAHRLKGRLDLDDNQTRRVEQIVRRRYQRILQARENMVRNVGPEIADLEKEINPLLTPDQRLRLSKRLQNFRDELLPTAHPSE